MELVGFLDVPSLLIFCIIILLVYILLSRQQQKEGNKPPGLPRFPIVGSLPYLGNDPREPLRKLSAKYGDIFRVYMGSREVVMLNSYEAIKEAFVMNGHDFSGRPQDLFFIEKITKGTGIISTEGFIWREQRKFVHSIFRQFGVGKAKMEEKIKQEVKPFLETLSLSCGKEYDPGHLIQMAIADIIYNIIFGDRFEYTDDTFLQKMKDLGKGFELGGNAGVLTVFPFLARLPGDMFGLKELLQIDSDARKGYIEQIAKHRKYLDPTNIQNFMDAYLLEINKKPEDGEDPLKFSSFIDSQLVAVICDLFAAGTETTSTTLRWAIIYMLHNPQVMAKVHQEIDDVVSREDQPSIVHRENLPYTHACLLEVQRLASVVPLGVPHSVTKDTTIKGYTLKKGTTVMSNIYAVHHDPTVWENPFQFNPNNFLDENGQLHKREKLIQFSMGKRVCLGENLAKVEIFLFFTAMLQRFTFTLPEGHELPDLTGHLTMTNMPQNFKIILQERP